MVETPYMERTADLSPDGRWLAYESNRSGQFEVWVQPFPNVKDGEWQVSRTGGMWPMWNPDGGDELFYIGSDGLIQHYQEGLDAYKLKNYITSLEKWQPLAEQGHVNAQYNLGMMYDLGHGVEQDFIEAFKWYRLSAKQGDTTSQYNLGLMYQMGQGVDQDYQEANKWFKIAEQETGNTYKNE